jgi:hypothetical protein
LKPVHYKQKFFSLHTNRNSAHRNGNYFFPTTKLRRLQIQSCNRKTNPNNCNNCEPFHQTKLTEFDLLFVVLRDSDAIPVTHARQIVLNTPHVEERVNVVELVSCFSLLILQRVSYLVLLHVESPLGIESGTETDKTKQKQKAAYESQNIAPLRKQTLLAHTINPQSDSLPRKTRKDADKIRIL